MHDTNHKIRVDVRLKRALESGTLPKELLVVGPAGTGKSFGILALFHLLCADYAGLRMLFCRQTRVSLTESILVTFEQEVLAADGMEAIAAGASRKYRSSYQYPNGSEIVLAGLDEPSRVGSTAWDGIFLNEAIEAQPEAWDTLGSRLNRPGRDPRFGYLIADTNPGDPSHWIKQRCDKGDTVLWDTSHEANPALHDGKGWTEAGRLYMERLARLRGTRAKRLYRGLWAAGEGQWFETFGDQHVSEAAEFDPRFPVHLAVDNGHNTAAVWFQIRPSDNGPLVTVFADYYAFGRPAYDNALAIQEHARPLCGTRFDRGVTDPAGDSPTGVGVTVLAEYARAGLHLDSWPKYPGSVVDGLSLIESFVAVDPPGLIVHPRCVHLITAFANYRRKLSQGQYIDVPEKSHPHDDLLDSLRGGLQDRYPDGRRPERVFRRVSSRSVF